MRKGSYNYVAHLKVTVHKEIAGIAPKVYLDDFIVEAATIEEASRLAQFTAFGMSRFDRSSVSAEVIGIVRHRDVDATLKLDPAEKQ